MKQHLSNSLSYLFYYLGDWISYPMNKLPWLYPLYSRLMLTSVRIQLWGGKGPWEEVED